MLEVHAVSAGYGRAQVLRDVSLHVAPGEILCLLGRNGAGKTTTMRAIMGHLPLLSGAVRLDGETLSTRPPHEVPRAGIGYVPQGRRLFGELTVAQNIEVGLMARGEGPQTQERVLDRFPRLRERLRQRANTLSGGEQQMLATARALCLRPKALLLDEPTEGLQPSMITAIRDVVAAMKKDGVAVLLVEQHLEAVFDLADRVAFIETGRVAETVTVSHLRENRGLVDRYLGV